MKRVVIEKPVETVINVNQINENQIVVGVLYCFDLIAFDKLSKVWINDIQKYQWCDLGSSVRWASCGENDGFGSIKDAINAYLKDSDSKVYVFDSFEQFLEEFPALVKSKK